MTQKEAYLMKEAINLLIKLTDPDRYCVAVEERLPALKDEEPDYAVQLFIRDSNKSGLIDLALLAHIIETMGKHFLSIESTYDAGTIKGEDIKQSVQIW